MGLFLYMSAILLCFVWRVDVRVHVMVGASDSLL